MSRWAEGYWLLTVLFAMGVGISLGCWAMSALHGLEQRRPFLWEAAANALFVLLFAMRFYMELRG